jgi:hypothetical protein
VPGFTYLRGENEDYSRAWYDAGLRVFYYVPEQFSAALLEVPDGLKDAEKIVEQLELMGLEQAIAALKVAQGISQVRASGRLMAMMLANRITVEHPDADRVTQLWRRMMTGSLPTVAGALYFAGFAPADSPITRQRVEIRE